MNEFKINSLISPASPATKYRSQAILIPPFHSINFSLYFIQPIHATKAVLAGFNPTTNSNGGNQTNNWKKNKPISSNFEWNWDCFEYYNSKLEIQEWNNNETKWIIIEWSEFQQKANCNKLALNQLIRLQLNLIWIEFLQFLILV